jgi:RNA polymerase sigma-70 factor (ECF subfamily)
VPSPADSLPPSERTLDPETTIELLRRIRSGDEEARDQLLARLLPSLRRWAHGRLSVELRGVHDTVDLVQETALKVLPKLDAIEVPHQGALQAYLRRAVTNRIIELARAHHRHPAMELPDDLIDHARSPLAQAIGAENVRRYERALATLSSSDQAAIHLRFELDYSYEELAVALGKPSPDSARVAVRRAVERLATAMSGLE